MGIKINWQKGLKPVKIITPEDFVKGDTP